LEQLGARRAVPSSIARRHCGAAYLPDVPAPWAYERRCARRRCFHDLLGAGCREHRCRWPAAEPKWSSSGERARSSFGSTTPRFVHWHSSGSAFCSDAGSTKRLTTSHSTLRRSEAELSSACLAVAERSVENEKPPVQKMPSWGLTSKTQKSIRSSGLLPDCQPIYPLAQTSLDRDAHHCSLGRQFVVVKLIRQRVAIMRESRTRTVRGVFLSRWPSPAY